MMASIARLISAFALLLHASSFYFVKPARGGAASIRSAAGKAECVPASPGAENRQRLLTTLRLTAVLGASLIGGQAARASQEQLPLCSEQSQSLREALAVGNSALDNVVVTKPNEERKFKPLTLANGLRVLLISDPSSSRSAAALDVHVGSFSDPDNVPGLAHFCEHMSFLGTRKFTSEDDFSSFLASHGGSSNAYTDNEDTVYYFDVNSEFLEPALDRFSQFFIAPLFTEAATSRELNAIDSEHAKNINNDGFRLYQLEKSGANPLHPLHKFATGNKATLETNTRALGVDLRQSLLSFHAQHYSSNLMTLCLTGQQPLPQLEAWARKFFSAVPDRRAPEPAKEWWGAVPAFLPQSSASLMEVVPVAESRRLSVTWPVPIVDEADRAELLAVKPEMFVSHLLGHEGAGSLRSLLVGRGWANGVGAAPSADVTDVQLFEASIELTEEGLRHRDDVLDTVFAYLHLLSHGRPSASASASPAAPAAPLIPPYIFREVSLLSQVSFNYTEKSDPADLASSLAADMQVYSRPAQYLTGSRIFNYFPGASECAVARYLSLLTPQRAQIKVVAKAFAGHTKEEGEWYGTNYNKVDAMPAETRRWAAVTSAAFPSLALPQPNELLPARFDLVSPPPASKSARDAALAAPPTLIRDDAAFSVWHKTDRSFLQPRVYAIVSLAVPASLYDAAFVMKSRLFAECFLDSLNEFLYDARLAGLTFELEFTSRGLQLTLGGFSDKLPLFAERILAALRTFKPDRAAFARFKDLQARSLAGWRTQQPYSHCSYFASIAGESLQYTVEDLKTALEKLDVASLASFLPGLLAQSHGTALVQGNIAPAGALDLVGAVERAFPFSALPQEARSRRVVNLVPLAPSVADSAEPEIGYRISRAEPNAEDDNSAVTFYFQIPSRAAGETMLLELLAEALEQGFYSDLRTQQQLGYIVFSGLRAREGVCSLVLTVQSNVLGGPGLARAVEAHLDKAVPELAALSKEDFAAYKEGIRVRKLEPDQRLTTQASRFWSEIVLLPVEQPQFDRHVREVEALDGITQQQFADFARQVLGRNGAKRRLLVSQVTSQQAKAEGAEGGEEGPAFRAVEDLAAWQRSLPVVL